MSIASIVCLLAVGAILLATNAPATNAQMIPQPLPDGKTGALNAVGAYDKSSGANLQAQVQQQLWQSENKRHELHGGASYAQHLGGPWGNSRPDIGVGAGYRYRF